MDAYDRVATGSGPEIAVVLGESGLGKTRLVQEFFARLSRGVDAEGEGGYWPDRLVRDANNLKVNPDPADCNPSRVADMRFLWWGIRMLDRSGHNAGLGGLSDSVALLRAHLEPFARARLVSGRIKDAAKSAALDVAIEIGNLFTFGLLGLGKLGIDHAGEWKSIRDDHLSLAGLSAADEEGRQRESLVELVLADLDALFDANGEKGLRLPAIILVDDAQWLSGDETTRIFVARVMAMAKERGWPLLLIATHWEREWHEHFADSRADTLAAMARQFTGDGWQPIRLGREPDLAVMIESGFPGLTPAQVQLLLEKAGGNPRLLDEMLRFLKRKKGFFENRDSASALSERGISDISGRTFGLHDLVADRLACSPESVRRLTGLAGLQGNRFLERLLIDPERIGERDYKADGLSLAISPHSLVAPVGNTVYEFTQPVYREVSLEQLSDLLDEDDARELIVARFLELAGPQGRFEALDAAEHEAAWLVGPELLSRDRTMSAQETVIAVRCYRRAIDAFYERHDNAGTAGLLERTASLIETMDGAPPAEIAEDMHRMLLIALREQLPKLCHRLTSVIDKNWDLIVAGDDKEAFAISLINRMCRAAASYGDREAAMIFAQRLVQLVAAATDAQKEEAGGISYEFALAVLAWHQCTAGATQEARASADAVFDALSNATADDAAALLGQLGALTYISMAYGKMMEWRAGTACCRIALEKLDASGELFDQEQRLVSVASLQSLLGTLLVNHKQMAEALEASEAALKARRQLLEDKPSHTNRSNAFSLISRLGRLYRTQGSFERSFELTGEALKLAREMAKAVPSRTNRLRLANAEIDAGDHLIARKSMNNGFRYYREALDTSRKLYREEPCAQTSVPLIGSLNRCALGYEREGDLDQAHSLLKEALEILIATGQEGRAPDSYEQLVNSQKDNIARLQAKMRNEAEGQPE